MKEITHLYHCTVFDSLCKIMSTGYFRPSFCLEELSAFHSVRMNMAYAVVCFADLLADQVKTHMRRFHSNSFLRMGKDWAKRNDISPVIYYTNNSNMASYLENIINYATDQFVKQNADKNQNMDCLKFVNSSQMLLAYMKQYEGRYWMKERKTFSEITNFYIEREWRYVPMPRNYEAFYLDEEEFMDQQLIKQKQDELVECGYVLRFGWDDIEEIGIPHESVKFLYQCLANNPEIKQEQISAKICLL